MYLNPDTSMCGSRTLHMLRRGTRKTHRASCSAASQCAKLSADTTTTVCSRHSVTGRRHNWHCDVPCDLGHRWSQNHNQLNMRTNDTSSVPKETWSVSPTIPSKTSECKVGCHAQSTLRGRPENDLQMCANKQRGAEGVLRSTRIVSLSIAMSSSPAAVARNTRTCGNGWGPLENGICS